MRVFVFLCLVAAAYAEGGYNYQATQQVSQGGSQQTYSAPSYASAPAPVEYSKEFYSYTAPDHEFEDNSAHQHINPTVKKNVQVVFIRGPESRSVENAALRLAQQQSQSRTDIYVLQKQADVGGFAQQLQSQGAIQSPPEVHFVKYRTQQDAQNAQQTIQSQYDQLPGSSSSHNGGQAPVLNYASQSQPISAPSPQAPGASYLPASVLRFFRK